MTIHDLKNAFNPDDFNPNLGFIYQLNEHKRFEQLILPDQIRAIYIFWWKGKQSDLKKLHRKIKLKGKKIPNKIKEAEDFDHYQHNIDLDTEWIRTFESQDHDSDTYFPIYVGKSTNLRKRIYQHLCTRIDSKEWRQEMLIKMNLDKKETDPLIKTFENHFIRTYSPTSTCQLRAGLELLYCNTEDREFWKNLQKHLCLSIFPFERTNDHIDVAHRFYLEDYLIGTLRPWFNLDTER